MGPFDQLIASSEPGSIPQPSPSPAGSESGDSTSAGGGTADADRTMAVIERTFAHLWMVRTFVKHCPEVEEFPELMQAVRTIFDTCRAIESQQPDPAAVLRMLRKKLGKLRQSAERFRHDAPLASGHTNFQQAVTSYDGCVRTLEELLAALPDVSGKCPG